MKTDPKLDLLLERVVDVPRDLVWEAWTKPEHIRKWFTPRPWITTECEIDLRPGGIFRFVMRSPEGEQFPYTGCYLEIVPKEKLIWTMLLGPGYRPMSSRPDDLLFTAVITLQSQGNGTKYSALAMHRAEDERKKHEEMGFHEGWGAALDQLVEVASTFRA